MDKRFRNYVLILVSIKISNHVVAIGEEVNYISETEIRRYSQLCEFRCFQGI